MSRLAAGPLFDHADDLRFGLRDDEVLLQDYRGEATDFVRLNHNQVRQAGHVRQGTVTTTLISGARHASISYPLQGDRQADGERGRAAIALLRRQLPLLPDDPYLNFDSNPGEMLEERPARMPPTNEMVNAIRQAGAGHDLVGLVSAGTVVRGFASSIGHRYWFSADSFHLDWSLHRAADQAVKLEYAGHVWSQDRIGEKTAAACRDLARMAQPLKPIEPGEYRAYLAPSALREWMVVTAMGGFGLKAQRSGQSPLLQMNSEGRCLSPLVHLAEHPGRGLASPFSNFGFVRPERTSLIESGRYHASLVNARSGREFGLPVTGGEVPDSLELAVGQLAGDEILGALDEGIYIGNAWYGNFSDRSRCAITGLTRFACFWVRDGRIVAPIPVMRFDDSLYRVLGEQLVGLSQERELLMDIYSYDGRSTISYLLPGALVAGLYLTL